MCDDTGVMLDAPKTIAGELFPHDDDIGGAEVEQLLCELSDDEFILRASENGKDYIIIRSWDEHQKIDKPSRHRWVSKEDRDRLAGVSRMCRETPSVGKGKGAEEREKDSNCSLRSQSSPLSEGGTADDLFDDGVIDLETSRKNADQELLRWFGESWNDLAENLGVPQARELTKSRQTNIRQRAADLVKIYDFPDARTGFANVFARIRGSPFLRGESGSFRVGIDFVVKKENFTKIMEGKYEDRTQAKSATK